MPRIAKEQKASGEIPIEYALMESKPFENITRYSCDMCGNLTVAYKLARVDECLYLCPNCFSHIEAISEKELKECLTRILLGNIL